MPVEFLGGKLYSMYIDLVFIWSKFNGQHRAAPIRTERKGSNGYLSYVRQVCNGCRKKAISAKRTEKTMALIKQNGGELKAGYALLGDIDLVLIVDLPDTEHAMQTSAALSKLLGVLFSTASAVGVEDSINLWGNTVWGQMGCWIPS